MSLSHIGQQISIYGGFFILLIGIIGNGMNIYVFASVRIYRTTPCSFYFLVGSIYNIVYILINVTSRIISVGYGIDVVSIATIWCKVRQFCLITLSLITLSCSCLATIDQYLATSQSVHLRRWSNIKWAHRIVSAVMIFWIIHGIPCLVFYTILPNNNQCMSINAVYAAYIPICIIILISAVPVMIMTIFGYLAYRNIRQTIVLAELQADRQLTRMTLIQIVLVIICIIPAGIYSAYALITAGNVKDSNRLIKENFVLTIVSLVAYFYYAGSCYMFLISSSRFRRIVKDRIFCWKRPNRIHPIQQAIF